MLTTYSPHHCTFLNLTSGIKTQQKLQTPQQNDWDCQRKGTQIAWRPLQSVFNLIIPKSEHGEQIFGGQQKPNKKVCSILM